jgi:hypothetical protein
MKDASRQAQRKIPVAGVRIGDEDELAHPGRSPLEFPARKAQPKPGKGIEKVKH